MRKITALEHITLDGVIQAGGGPDEDRSGGFAYGGWCAPYDDDVIGAAVKKMLDLPVDLLLGRKTFEAWATFWPQHGDFWPNVNTATKYVVEHHDVFRLATLGVFKRRCGEKSRRAQARAGPRSARLGKQQSAPDADEA